MQLFLENLGKRFNRQWVFRGLSIELEQGNRCVILGRNGSGKSTLLQTIAGFRVPSEGMVHFTHNDKIIPVDIHYKYIAFASPYLELIEDFNMSELLQFHFGLKKIIPGINTGDFEKLLQMPDIQGKPIKQYSSGMKQRLKLALAFFTDAPVLLLDEPCSNLDAQGINWYRDLLDKYSQERLTVICSNHQESEYMPCQNKIEIEQYKHPGTSLSGEVL